MLHATLRSAAALCALLAYATGFAAQLSEAIQPASLDERLLARAIFDETNRTRTRLKLPAFGAEPKLAAAAETQAQIGSVFRPPSHTNPFPLIATPLARVKFAGLNPEFVAENIAQISIYDVPSGGSVYYLKNDRTLRDARNGEPVRTHTYASFARAIVEAWMNSPGHRENIVSPTLRFLGCATRMSQSQDDIPMIFAVQAFYTPKKRNGKQGRLQPARAMRESLGPVRDWPYSRSVCVGAALRRDCCEARATPESIAA